MNPHTHRVDELLERMRQANISNDAGVGAALWLILCASDSRRFSPSEQDAVGLICDELIGVIERTQQELAELDAWATKCEAESR
jgi:hypothetical protein